MDALTGHRPIRAIGARGGFQVLRARLSVPPALRHAQRAVERHGREGGADGIDGEEMAELDLQDGEGGKGRGQQAHPGRASVVAPPIGALGQQIDEEHGEGVGDGHQQPADDREAGHAVGGAQRLDPRGWRAQLLGQRCDGVKGVGGQHQQVEGEVAVGVGAALLALNVPEGVEGGLALVQQADPLGRHLDAGRVEGNGGALVGVRQLAVGPVDVPNAQHEAGQQDQQQQAAHQPGAPRLRAGGMLRGRRLSMTQFLRGHRLGAGGMLRGRRLCRIGHGSGGISDCQQIAS